MHIFIPLIKKQLFNWYKYLASSVIAVQLAYIVWQVVLLTDPPPRIAPEFFQAIQLPPQQDNWAWLKQSTKKRVIIAAPKKTYQFPTLNVSINGIIYREAGSSIAIVSSKLMKSVVLSDGDRLGDTDVIVEDILPNGVVFLEVDKRFTIYKEESVLPELVTDDDAVVASPSLLAGNRAQRAAKATATPSTVSTVPTQRFTPSNEGERNFARALLQKPERLLEYLLLVPIFENKIITGIRVTVLKRQALFTRIGLHTNDVIVAVNGTPVANVKPDMLEKRIGHQRLTLSIKEGNDVRNIEISL